MYLLSLWALKFRKVSSNMFTVFRGILPIFWWFSKKLSTAAVVHQKNILTDYYVPQTKFGETYCVCSDSYYVPQTKFGRYIVFALCLISIILITSPLLLSGDVLLFYVSFSLLLLFLLLFFHTFLCAWFLGDALIKLDETL